MNSRYLWILTLAFLMGFTPVGSEFGGSKSLLQDFTVYSKDDHIKITWKTKSRDKIEIFDIQRSRDAKKFLSYKIISDEGMEPGAMEFFEIDSNPLLGWSYYRIKQIFNSGDSAFSPIAPVFYGKDRLAKGQVIAAKNPNDPSTFKVSLSRFNNERALLVARDANGNEYYISETLTVKGNNISVAASKQIPAGSYTITASSIDEILGLTITAQ